MDFVHSTLQSAFPPDRSEWALLTTPFSMHCFDMPRPAERNAEHKNLVKRCTSSQSLGLFRLQEEAFLLCYDSKYSLGSLQSPRVRLNSPSEFGVYIDKYGTLIGNRLTVEWEGVAERASYHHPYVLLFSNGFVEVRHAASGRLEQVIRGDGMRCIWEGRDCRGEDPTTVQPSQEDLGVIGVTHAPAGLDELTVQCIFTLVPSTRPYTPIETQPPSVTFECASSRL